MAGDGRAVCHGLQPHHGFHIMAPALPSIAKELHMSDTEAAMSLSIYLLATAFGPLAIGPLSELYGRQVVLHASAIWVFV